MNISWKELGSATSLLALMAMPHNSAFAQSGNSQNASNEEIDAIIVTALRREGTVLDTPAAISVVSEEIIENAGVTRPSDFAALIPNVTITPTNRAGEAFITIRGVAQARTADSTVAVIVDGVQLGSAEEFNQELFDVKQIEVLKGPQGALYGRNAIGGAIVITSKDPSNELEASATVGYGNANSIKAIGTLSVPVIEDKVFVRVSGYHRENDGYFLNSLTGRNVDPASERGIRARLDLRPNDNLTIDIRGALAYFDGSGINYIPQFGVLDTDSTTRFYDRNVPGLDIQKKRSLSMKIDYETPEGTITFTPAYSHVRENLTADSFPYDATPTNTQAAMFYFKTLSAELKFASRQNRRFTYLVGGYAANINRRDTVLTGIDTGQGVVLRAPGGPYSATSINPTISMQDDSYEYDVLAAFAQASYEITDSLELSLAARYDHEKRRQVNETPAAFSTFSGLERKEVFEGFQPKATLRYKITPTINIYADYGRGFVSGGFNPAQTQAILQAADPTSTTPNEYDKQTSEAYELGFKSELLDRKLTFNAALFHTNIKNLQQFQFFPAATLQAINPIDKAKIDGFEAELNFRPVYGLTLFASGGYTDAKISKLASTPALEGNKTPYVPEYTINGGFQYEHEIVNDVAGTIRVDYQRIGPQWFDIANTPGTRRSAVDLVNARLSVGNDRWELSGWAKNLFNKIYNIETIVITPNAQILYPATPRTYGVELKVKL